MIDKFVEKCTDSYGCIACENINENGVIMVTVTLKEYRELVAKAAKAEQAGYDNKLWEAQKEIERLRQSIVNITMGDDVDEF